MRSYASSSSNLCCGRNAKDKSCRKESAAEALEQQTATSEMLTDYQLLATDVQPVLDAVARKMTKRL